MNSRNGVMSKLFGMILAAAALWLGGAIAQAGTIGGEDVDWTQWREVEPLPSERYSMVAGSLNGELYAAGGMGAGSPYERTNTYQYTESGWTEVAGLPLALGGSGYGVFNSDLYAVGGSAGGASESTNVVRFDGTNWTAASALPVARYGVAVGILGGNLYAIGGWVSYASVTNVYRFNGATWTEVTGLPTPRKGMAVATLGANLYAIGGYGANFNEFCTNVYCYNGTTWTELKGLPMRMDSSRAGVLEGQIYVVGGKTADFVNSTNVFRFDGTNWTEIVGLPQERSSVGLAVHNDTLYAIGGSWGEGYPANNVFVYPWRTNAYSGVDPEFGSVAGTYSVTITGTDLCDGTLGDVTNVTLCGVWSPAIDVSGTTQIVVQAGTTVTPGLGDVKVYSASRGISTKVAGFTYEGTTRVVLYDFFLREEHGVMQVCWSTASEEDTVGFNLYREQNGAWVKVNEALIIARDPMGATYGVMDPAANATDTFRYKLVEVETDGSVREYGPFERAAWTPRLENVGVGENGIVLRWLSRAGESYEVRRSRSLMVPLETIADGLPATPPVNEFTDEEKAEGAAFYQIRVE